MANSKILFLAHRIPYPPNKGDKIRSFNEIKHLSRSHEIHIACLADDPNDIKYKIELKRYCRHVHVGPLNKTGSKIKGLLHLLRGGSISVGYFYNRKIQRVVDQWLSENTYDAIFCFSSPMAEYIFRSKLQAPSSTLIIDFCDLDSDKWRQYGDRSRFPLSMIYKLESRLLLAYEKKVNQTFDNSLFVSQQEADLFVNVFPNAKNLTVIPNGVDHNYFSPDQLGIRKKNPGVRSQESEGEGKKEDSRIQGFKDSRRTKQINKTNETNTTNQTDSTNQTNPTNLTNRTNKLTLLFTGAMDYHANVDGVVWFCRRIFPRIKETFPTAKFYIVGSNPHPSVKSLEMIDGVHVTGFVEDMRPYYQMADVCVIPLRLARGVQNKVLEAMAMAKPVVTTSSAIQGITAMDGRHLIVADSPHDFVESVNNLCNEMNRRETLALAGRSFVQKHYDWDTNLHLLDGLIQKN